MALIALYDACVLYPAPLRDLLIRVSHTGLVRARWSNAILDECFRNIAASRSDLDPAFLQRTRNLMNAAVPDCLVEEYETLIPDLHLPDSDDRHVLAAAITGNAEVIVTKNLRDFPADVLAEYDIEAQHPDDFVLRLVARANGPDPAVDPACVPSAPLTHAGSGDTQSRVGGGSHASAQGHDVQRGEPVRSVRHSGWWTRAAGGGGFD